MSAAGEPTCDTCGHFDHEDDWCDVDVIVSSGFFEQCGCPPQAASRTLIDVAPGTLIVGAASPGEEERHE